MYDDYLDELLEEAYLEGYYDGYEDDYYIEDMLDIELHNSNDLRTNGRYRNRPKRPKITKDMNNIDKIRLHLHDHGDVARRSKMRPTMYTKRYADELNQKDIDENKKWIERRMSKRDLRLSDKFLKVY